MPSSISEHDDTDRGIYVCVACTQAVYSSDDKIALPDGTLPWSVFEKPLSTTAVSTRADFACGMRRIAIHCQKCNAHLGHLFKDAGALERHTIAPTSVKFLDPKDIHLRKTAVPNSSTQPQTNIFTHAPQPIPIAGKAMAIIPIASILLIAFLRS